MPRPKIRNVKPTARAIRSGIRARTAEALKLAASYLFFRYRYSCHFEVGIQAWGKRRVDIVGNKISGQLVVVEVKSSWADLTTDTKLLEYLPYADRFYICVTSKVWQKLQTEKRQLQRLTSRTGVLVLNETTGYAEIKRPARHVDVAPELRLNMLARLAWRNGALSKRVERSRKRVYVVDSTSA